MGFKMKTILCLFLVLSSSLCMECEDGQVLCDHLGHEDCSTTCDGSLWCDQAEDQLAEACENCTLPGLTFCDDITYCVGTDSFCNSYNDCLDGSDVSAWTIAHVWPQVDSVMVWPHVQTSVMN